MSKKKQIRLDKDNTYTLVTPQSYESLADFIVKNGEYKFVKDYEYLSKEGVGFRVSANVLTVYDCLFDVSELTKQHHPETGVYLTLLKGSLDGDKDSMWVIQFQRCTFYTMLDKANPKSHTGASLCLNENCVFKSCKFFDGAAIRTKKHLGFVNCNGREAAIVVSDAKASSCRLEGLGYNELLHLTLSNFPIVEVVKADGVPKDFSIANSCKVSFADCKITGVLGEVLTYNRFYITGMHSGYPGNALYFTNCEIDEPIHVDSSIVHFNAIGSKLDRVRVTNSIVKLLYADGASNIVKMDCNKCIFQNPNDLNNYTHENLNLFPTKSVGYGDFNPLTLYKKVYTYPKLYAFFNAYGFSREEIIAKLEVPRHAERHIDISTGKIRVSEAVVTQFYTFDNGKLSATPYEPDIFTTVRSLHDKSFKYKVGKIVKPKYGFDKSDNDCGSGIHGFLTPEEAINYGR